MSRSNDIAGLTTSILDGVSAAEVGLGNVTNESKATMFTSPTFTGDVSATNIKNASSSSNNIVLASDGNVSITNTLSAGTIGDNVNTTNKYYLQLKAGANHTIGSGGDYIDTVGTTNPYFVATGDTTNILPTDTTNIKIIRKGIYLLTFSLSAYQHSNTISGEVIGTIRGGTSVNPTTVLVEAKDNISNTTTEPDWSNSVCTYIAELPANYYLRYHYEGKFANDITIDSVSHAVIALIRPTA